MILKRETMKYLQKVAKTGNNVNYLAVFLQQKMTSKQKQGMNIEKEKEEF